MTGLEKLLAKLDEENRSACEAVLAEAQREAERVTAQAEEDGRRQAEETVSAARRAAAEQERLARSAADMCFRRKTLEVRVAAVDEAVAGALDALEGLRGDAFYDAILTLVAANAMDGRGRLLMTEDDVRDMPPDFPEKLAEALGKGRSLTIEAASLRSRGAVVSYGDIEVDLRFSELIAAQEDALRSVAQAILFP